MLPCTDEGSNDAIGAEANIHIQGDEGHQDTDFCSPFCLCHCCQTNVATGSVFDKDLMSDYYWQHQTLYIGIPGKIFPDSILQPPQV